MKKFSGGFAIPNAGKSGGAGDLIEEEAGFVAMPNAPRSRPASQLRKFGRRARFQNRDEGCAVHGDAGNEAAAHEISDYGPRPVYNVAAHAPENSGGRVLRVGWRR